MNGIIPGGRFPETESEKLLAGYFDAHGHEYMFEPTIRAEIAAMRSRGTVTRVCVCEHPRPRVPLAREMFCGPYDERWSIGTHTPECVFAGPLVWELLPSARDRWIE